MTPQSMINSIISFFNRGVINQTNNYNINNASVKTLVDSIRSSFFDGNIVKAVEDLSRAKKEYQQNADAKYHFLVIEIEFYFTLKKFDDARSKIAHIEEYCNLLLDARFYEIKASLLSIDGFFDEYNKIVSKIKNEFMTNPIEDSYFDLLFYINSGNLEKSRIVFESNILSKNEINIKLIYLGGLIYSNLYYKNQDNDLFEKAKKHFDHCLLNESINLFEKIDIYLFYSSIELDNYYENKSCDKEIISRTINCLEKIKDNFSLFSEDYTNILSNRLLHCYFLTNKEDFHTYYKDTISIEKDVFNFINYNFSELRNFDQTEVEKRTLIKGEDDLLIYYLMYLSEHNTQHVLHFYGNNPKLLNSPVIFNYYVKYVIEKSLLPLAELNTICSNRKNSSHFDALTNIMLQQHINTQLSSSQKTELYSLYDLLKSDLTAVSIVLDMLGKNNLSEKYLSIGIELQSNPNILEQVLKLCITDDQLSIPQFEKFKIKLNVNVDNRLIGDFFLKHQKLKEAYHYYTAYWQESVNDHVDFKLHVAIISLYYCSSRYYSINYMQSNNRINVEQDNIFRSFIENNIARLNAKQICQLSYFIIVVEKNLEHGFKLLNKYLLSTDYNSIDHEIKLLLASMFFLLIIHKNEFNTDNIFNNIVIEKDSNCYIDNSIYKIIDPSYSILDKENNDFELLNYDPNSEIKSLFHCICNHFLDELKGNNFQVLYCSQDDPLSSLKPLLDGQAKSSSQKFTDYSKGNNIAFHQMVGEYHKYFPLIKELINRKDIKFHAGECFFVSNIKKILTLSSIIFLDYIGELDYVLSRDDVFIQKTLMDWLGYFIRELDKTNEIFNLFSDGENIYRDIKSKQHIELNKKTLLTLATKLNKFSSKIIDDSDEIFWFGESFDLLVPLIGLQEYRALAYAFKNGFQIISEDRAFNLFTNELGLKKYIVSNSIALIDHHSKIMNNKFSFYTKLHNIGYGYIFDQNNISNYFLDKILNNRSFLSHLRISKWLGFFACLAFDYGWFEFLNIYYKNNYEFYIPMAKAPVKDFVSNNIEGLFLFVKDNKGYFLSGSNL